MYVYLHAIIVRITDAILEKRKKRKVPSAIVDVRNARYGHPFPGRETCDRSEKAFLGPSPRRSGARLLCSDMYMYANES